MKPSIYRRMRRRPASREAASFKKDNQPEQQFFGETMHEPFFKPATAMQQSVQRKCTDCEKEDKVQRSPEKKEEEKVMKKEEKKEEKVQRAADKKEDEKKVQRAADKKEEEKVQKKEDKKEEKVMKKEDKKEEEKVQKKETAAATSTTSPTASNYISSINGKGQSMDAGVQSFYENRIGADFSDVKIHTGKEAAESAKDINAQAYAYGNHIVFNEGKYQPESGEGKHLLAHELAHVVQQNKESIDQVKVQRAANFVASTPVYDVNLAEQFVAETKVPTSGEFGSTHPLINSQDLTVPSDNPIKVPADSDLSTVPVGQEFESSVTTIPLNETSFHMRLPQKGLTKWAKNVPIADVPDLFINHSCRISNTDIEVTGNRTNTSVITKTHVHEGVHAQHIRACHNDYIAKFDQFLTTRKAKAPTKEASKKKLLTTIDGMATAMWHSFVQTFSQKAVAFHSGATGGKGNFAITNISQNCSKVEISATN